MHAGYMPLIGFMPGTQVFTLWPKMLLGGKCACVLCVLCVGLAR